MQVVYAGCHLGPSMTAFIFSIWPGLRSYTCMISWSGEWCFLTYHVAAFHTFGARGCISGRQASLVAALRMQEYIIQWYVDDTGLRG